MSTLLVTAIGYYSSITVRCDIKVITYMYIKQGAYLRRIQCVGGYLEISLVIWQTGTSIEEEIGAGRSQRIKKK